MTESAPATNRPSDSLLLDSLMRSLTRSDRRMAEQLFEAERRAEAAEAKLAAIRDLCNDEELRYGLLTMPIEKVRRILDWGGRDVTESVPAGDTAVVACRFCGAPAVAVYMLSDGCVCFPDDREQALCAQHENRATPLGDMKLLREIG